MRRQHANSTAGAPHGKFGFKLQPDALRFILLRDLRSRAVIIFES